MGWARMTMNPISYTLAIFLAGFLMGQECLAAEWQTSSSFKSANPPGAIGESGTLFLTGQGFHANPFYNDVFGDTDKQLSGASQFGYLQHWRDSSAEIRTHWRFITPSFKEKFGRHNLEVPVGRYADWMEVQGSWAHLVTLKDFTFRIQPTLGIGEIGDHGAKKVHRRIHKVIGASLLGLDYDDQPHGPNISRGLEMGFIEMPAKYSLFLVESMLSLGYFKTRFMDDVYLNQNHVFTFSPTVKVGLEIRAIRQIHSEALYGNELSGRFEISTGVRFDWYRPVLKYVSPFIRDDQVGQFYLDPLGICYEID